MFCFSCQNCTMSCWIKIGAAFQSASDVAVVQRPGKKSHSSPWLRKTFFIANIACCVCFIVADLARFRCQHGNFPFFSGPEPQEQKHSWLGTWRFYAVLVWRSISKRSLWMAGFATCCSWLSPLKSNSRILCPICCILHLALQDLETQVHLWTKHRHTGLAADFHSSGAGKLCLTSACRDLGSNGQFSCPVFIFVNENDRTGILTNLPKLSWPGELHAGCHSPMCLGAPLVQRSVIATEFCFGQTDTFFVVVCVCCVYFCIARRNFSCIWSPGPCSPWKPD